MGPGAVDTGTDPGPGDAPARGDAGAAAATVPTSHSAGKYEATSKMPCGGMKARTPSVSG